MNEIIKKLNNKIRYKYVFSSSDNYELAFVFERKLLHVLLVEFIACFFATCVSFVVICLYIKFINPNFWNYIVMNKLSIASISLIIVALIFAIYFGYNNYQEKQRLRTENAELFGKIEQLNQSIAKNNQIIADNENNKRELENQSIERQEQINEQLKNSNCANEYVPVSVADSLYNRAKSLRQSSNTSESTNRQHSKSATKIHEIRR